VRRLHAAGRTYRYTLAWSRDGARLAVGYFTERRVGRETLPGAGDIVIASLDGGLTRVGCEASKMVYAWVAADTIVVGDGRELNPVDIRGCRSNASMRLQGKREITFSPDGKRLFYFATGQVRRGRRTVAATELYVARYDGSAARRIIGDPYDPQQARWSPDGARLAFDVRPPDGPTLRHIAVFDVAQQRVRFFPSRTAEGTPRGGGTVAREPGLETRHRAANPVCAQLSREDDFAQRTQRAVVQAGSGARACWRARTHGNGGQGGRGRRDGLEKRPPVDLAHGACFKAKALRTA